MNIGLHRIWKFQKPQRIGDVTSAFADDLGDLFLAVAEFIDQRTIAVRLFERIEIGTLHILDDGKLQRFGVGRLNDDDGNLVQPGALRRAPAPFASDDLEHVGRAAQRSHHDWLNDAAFAQRSGEFVELGCGECTPRITRIRPQRPGRQSPLAARPFGRAFAADIADQCGEPASQS